MRANCNNSLFQYSLNSDATQMTSKMQELILQSREGCNSARTAQNHIKARSTAQSKIPTMNYRRRGIQTRSNILKHPPARSPCQKIVPKKLSAQLTTPKKSVHVNQTIPPNKLTVQSYTPKRLTDQTTIPTGSTTQGNTLTRLGVQRTVQTRSTAQRTTPTRSTAQRTVQTRSAAQRTTPKRSTAQRTTPKRSTAQRTTPKRSTAQRTTPKRSTAQRTTPKRSTAQRTTPTRSTAQRTTPKRSTAQRTTPKRSTAQRTTPKRSTAQRTTPTRSTAQRTTPTRSTAQRTIPQTITAQSDTLSTLINESNLLTLSPIDKEITIAEQDETEANEVEYFQTTYGKRRTSLPAQVTIHPATRLAAVAERKYPTISLRRSPFRMTANRMKLRQRHLKTSTPISRLREQTLLKQRPINVDSTPRRIDVDMLLKPSKQTAKRSAIQMDSTTINSRLISPSLVMTTDHSYSPLLGSDITVTQRPATKSLLYEVAQESESGRSFELNAITPEVKQRSACLPTPGNQPSLANNSGSPVSRSTRVKLKTHTPRNNKKCARAFNSPTRSDSKILRSGKKLAPRLQAMRLKTKFSPSSAVPKNSKPGEPTKRFGTLLRQNVETPEKAIGRLPTVASPRNRLLSMQSLQIVDSVVLRSGKKLPPRISKVQTSKTGFLSSPAKSFTCSPKRLQRCHTPERLKTNSSVNITPRSQKTPQSYVCNVCHERLSDKKSMLRHQRCHQKGVAQDGGGLTTPNKGTLVRTPKIISKPSTDFECDVCQKKFRFRSNLKAHHAIHDQQRIFECSLCQNSLIVTALHNCHVVAKVVGQPENKNTDGCSDGHGHSRDTRTHAQTRIRRFMCDKCARTFASESNLKIHMKTHTLDKLRDILKATSSRFTAE